MAAKIAALGNELVRGELTVDLPNFLIDIGIANVFINYTMS